MSFIHNYLQRLTVNGVQLSKSNDVVSGAESSVSEPIPTGSTNLNVLYTLDVSQVKSFYICCDQAVTVKTNSTGSPANTLTLLAGVPYIWNTSQYDTFKITTDVTTLYVTNASGVDATLDIQALYDPT